MENAIKVWSHPDYLQVELASAALNEANIEGFIMDKRDSSYPGILGQVELYVDEAYVAAAKTIINEKFA